MGKWITPEMKKFIIKHKRDHPDASGRVIAEIASTRFNIKIANFVVEHALRSERKRLGLPAARRTAPGRPNWPEVDAKMVKWCLEEDPQASLERIRAKAKEVASEMGCISFMGGASWVNGFLKRSLLARSSTTGAWVQQCMAMDQNLGPESSACHKKANDTEESFSRGETIVLASSCTGSDSSDSWDPEETEERGRDSVGSEELKKEKVETAPKQGLSGQQSPFSPKTPRVPKEQAAVEEDAEAAEFQKASDRLQKMLQDIQDGESERRAKQSKLKKSKDAVRSKDQTWKQLREEIKTTRLHLQGLESKAELALDSLEEEKKKLSSQEETCKRISAQLKARYQMLSRYDL